MSAATGLEVAIALSFLYLVFSLVISRINEAVAALLEWRANTLQMALRQLLTGEIDEQAAKDTAGAATAPAGDGTTLGEQLLELSRLQHPLVKRLHPPKLFGRGTRPPSYLDPKVFSHAMLEILAPERPAAPDAMQLTLLSQVADTVDKLGSHPLRDPLKTLLEDAAGNLDRFRLNLEDWFNQAMQRVSGFYKRKVQLALLVYALLLAILLNIDTVTLGRSLWTNGVLRQAVVAAAGQQGNQTAGDVAETLRKVPDLNLPLGWSSGPAGDLRRPPTGPGGWLLKLLGLLLTVLALSLGSEFWFQLLNKLINLRSTGPPPAATKQERVGSDAA
jgi:hypothetical protein